MGKTVRKLVLWEEAGILPRPRFKVSEGTIEERQMRWYSPAQIANVREALRLYALGSQGVDERLKRVLSQVFYLDSPASSRDLLPRRHFSAAFGPKVVRVVRVARVPFPEPAETDAAENQFRAQLLALVGAIIPLWRTASESTNEAERVMRMLSPRNRSVAGVHGCV